MIAAQHPSTNGTAGEQPQAPPPRPRRKRRLSPLVADAARLAKLLQAGLRSIRTWDAAGKLPRPIKLGVRTVWVVSEIRAWLKAGAIPACGLRFLARAR